MLLGTLPPHPRMAQDIFGPHLDPCDSQPDGRSIWLLTVDESGIASQQVAPTFRSLGPNLPQVTLTDNSADKTEPDYRTR
jgi:hypothetical protein